MYRIHTRLEAVYAGNCLSQKPKKPKKLNKKNKPMEVHDWLRHRIVSFLVFLVFFVLYRELDAKAEEQCADSKAEEQCANNIEELD